MTDDKIYEDQSHIEIVHKQNVQLAQEIKEIDEQIAKYQKLHQDISVKLQKYQYQPNFLVIHKEDQVVGLTARRKNSCFYISAVANVVLLLLALLLWNLSSDKIRYM
ncbi:Hypothetical_protein [Hexamita inflata]|uniref:Hypothetical_protein n=1 Tax=Hexamita inflata TaxID=28002 RepID=A0AA86P3N6_9EUKA|nr:Hypothetical protein HINF_LOCUS8680 [Hexamita inflata]CAI9931304.1 Hypothetical protein HINF_LOCUS18949 [Hexamita inflata]CAI9976083.1 Hypothetical protein HINF_LOCUS63728 [Hexamita inflata]